ncbi:hypothetical protein GALMADRAFT_1262703 [Galerina marginata CBS 339.88]|uniref:Uncharacterized protein n=1 Tax=Galerina marginata (strain CBS 339.88) TaxID=685588 RepID=A0A067TFI7_GALM3|nr:hypothetical protein GALMADRAFT_1262703 [Galerina marginata CBS 339.88]
MARSPHVNGSKTEGTSWHLCPGINAWVPATSVPHVPLDLTRYGVVVAAAQARQHARCCIHREHRGGSTLRHHLPTNIRLLQKSKRRPSMVQSYSKPTSLRTLLEYLYIGVVLIIRFISSGKWLCLLSLADVSLTVPYARPSAEILLAEYIHYLHTID